MFFLQSGGGCRREWKDKKREREGAKGRAREREGAKGRAREREGAKGRAREREGAKERAREREGAKIWELSDSSTSGAWSFSLCRKSRSGKETTSPIQPSPKRRWRT